MHEGLRAADAPRPSPLPDQAQRAWLAPEERELRDVERQMEEELIAQHMHADRAIAARGDPDGSLRYLVKVGGPLKFSDTCAMPAVDRPGRA